MADRRVNGMATELHQAARLFARQWKPMALWTILVHLAISSILSPLIAAAIRRGLFRGERSMLGGFDINYYLEVQPIEWTQALVVAVIWSLLFLILSLALALRLLPLLPVFLSGKRTLRHAIRRAWSLTGRQILRLAVGLAVIAILWVTVRGLLQAIVLLPFSYAIEATRALSHPLRWTALLAGAWLFFSWLIGTTVSFAGFSLGSSWLTLFHFQQQQQARATTASQSYPPPNPHRTRSRPGCLCMDRQRPRQDCRRRRIRCGWNHHR